MQDYEVINDELKAYSSGAGPRVSEIVVATKIDALRRAGTTRGAARLRVIADGRTLLAISAVANRGLRELVEHGYRAVG